VINDCKVCGKQVSKQHPNYQCCSIACAAVLRKGKKPHNKLDLNEDIIVDLYKRGLSMFKIAELFDVTATTIHTRIKKYNISRKRGFAFGKYNPGYNGGFESINREIRANKKYYVWRSSIFERDNYTCNYCNQKGGKLHAHHIEHLSDIIKEHDITNIEKALSCKKLWNTTNGLTLCIVCHNKVHGRIKNGMEKSIKNK